MNGRISPAYLAFGFFIIIAIIAILHQDSQTIIDFFKDGVGGGDGDEIDLVEGTSIDIALSVVGDRATYTITATGSAGGSSNSFETMNAPSGTDPVAESSTDTLNLLVSGTDITITGSAAADSLTWDLVTNAGTDITADLEEEGQINTTVVSDNAASGELLIGTGVSTASFTAMSGDATITSGGVIEVTQADALEANGANCSAGNAPLGVDASGAVEGCFDVEEEGQVNTTVVTGNAADDQIILGSGASTAAWASVPNCTDTGGQHLNYTTATNTVSCGTSGAGAAFSGEVDDTTNDALTFTTDDGSPPASTVRSIFARNTDELRYNVPSGGLHEITVGGTAALTVNIDRITLPGTAVQPSSPVNSDLWFNANMQEPFFRSGGISGFPWLLPRRLVGTFPDSPTAGTFHDLGISPSPVGTCSAVTVDANGLYINCASAASAGSNAGVQSGNADGTEHTRRSFNPTYIARAAMSATTSIRLFFGFYDHGVANPVDSDDPATVNYAGIQYSTDRPDTNFQCISEDGTTQSRADTGVAADTSFHNFMVYMDNNNSRVVCMIDNSITVLTTNLPTATANLGTQVLLEARAASARTASIGWMFTIQER